MNATTDPRARVQELIALRRQIDSEIARVAAVAKVKAPERRTPRGQRPPCGTDRGYYWHRNHDEDQCAPCRRAHADAETVRKIARRRRVERTC